MTGHRELRVGCAIGIEHELGHQPADRRGELEAVAGEAAGDDDARIFGIAIDHEVPARGNRVQAHPMRRELRTRGREALEQAVRTANTEILSEAAREADYSGMGTTVVAALVNGRTVSYTSVGDSRGYLWRRNDLAQLTQDDSWLTSALADVAAVDSALMQMHPMRHVLTRVVGLRAELEPSANQIEIENSDMLLLCSDGLHGSLSDSAIASVLSGGQDVPHIAERLVEEALARGATDNVTAVVVRRD